MKALVTLEDVDTFRRVAALGLPVGDGGFAIASRRKAASPAQREVLRHLGVDVDMDRRQASRVIALLRARAKERLATPFEVLELLRLGVRDDQAATCSHFTARKILRDSWWRGER